MITARTSLIFTIILTMSTSTSAMQQETTHPELIDFLNTVMIYQQTESLNSFLSKIDKNLLKQPLNEQQQTLFHILAENKQNKLLKKALKFAPTLNLTDNNGNTPLHTAVDYEDLKCVKLLLKKSATFTQEENATFINAQNKDGNTALHLATMDHRWDMCCAITDENQANPQLRNKDEKSVFNLMGKSYSAASQKMHTITIESSEKEIFSSRLQQNLRYPEYSNNINEYHPKDTLSDFITSCGLD